MYTKIRDEIANLLNCLRYDYGVPIDVNDERLAEHVWAAILQLPITATFEIEMTATATVQGTLQDAWLNFGHGDGADDFEITDGLEVEDRFGNVDLTEVCWDSTMRRVKFDGDLR